MSSGGGAGTRTRSERSERRKSNTETRRHGGRTEGLWPARLRRAGRTRPTVRNASAPASFRAFAFRTVDLVGAARSAAPQAFSPAALMFFPLLRASSVPRCLRVEFVSVLSAPSSPSTPANSTPNQSQLLKSSERPKKPDARRLAIRNSQLISFTRVSKQYGRQILFVDASFQLNPGEKVGLVGPNGAGKTTLFRMIVGEEAPDEGDVTVPKKLTIGYFRQDVEEMSGRTVLDEAIAGSGRVGDLHHELEALQHAMADPAAADMDRVLARFGEVQEEYEHLGGYALESQAREVLHGLGFSDERIDGDVGALSGGWKMRVAMARVLLGRPDVLLMDEPTNHLDIESIIWLEAFLKSLPGALLMTSHDKDFMNRLVTRIAEIDGGEITAYTGNYDFYERERAVREANREAAYARQQAMLAK